MKQRTKLVENDGLTTVLGIGAYRGPLAILLKTILYAAIVLVFAGPLVALLVGAFSKVSDPTRFSLLPHGFTFRNFEVAGERGVYRYLFNSFVVVGFGLLLQMVVSVFAAYALARKRFRGAALVMLAILATMMLPEEVIAIPLSVVLSDMPLLHVNLIGSYAGMILPLGAWGFSILVMTEFMRDVPVHLEEAARLDGAGELRVFWSVVLPLCRPALGVIGVFGFTMIWDQYLLPLLIVHTPKMNTLTLLVTSLQASQEQGEGVRLAAAVVLMVPSVLVYLGLQRLFERGLLGGALKG